MKFLNAFKNAKPLVKITTISGLLLCLSIPLFFIAFPHILKKQWLVEVVYLSDSENPRVITVYQEIGNSDDGSYISGYWLYLHDPTIKKPVDRIFLDRTENDIPPSPKIHLINNEVWLISTPGLTSNEKPYLKILKVDQDQFTEIPVDFLNDWNISSIIDDKIQVSNKFSELGCLDPISKKVTNTPCTYPNNQTSDTVTQSIFFLVKNTGTSIRSKLYYYHSTKSFPAAGIFAGFTSPTGTTPGWHLPDAVKMSYGSIDPAMFDSYKSAFESCETAIAIQETLLNSPFVLHQNDSICTISHHADDGKTVYLEQFNAKGKSLWKTVCPTLKSNTFASTLRVEYSNKVTVFIHPQNWVLCIDNANGNIKWQCPQ